MTSTDQSLELLKADLHGRVRASPERREALVDEFERSGLSGMRFAARYGLKYPTFASWILRRKKQRGGTRVPERAGSVRTKAVTGEPVRWMEAVAAGPERTFLC